MKNVGFLSY